MCSSQVKKASNGGGGGKTFTRADFIDEDLEMIRFCRYYSRNIGIIAHIDAGKTTTTERMLYLSGKTNRLGDVDHGDTVTDFLPAERERGITIQSAAISFDWNNVPVNLIDTPGHADFTFEVVRSLRVLDGTVTVLDAVAGVEAQTEKVWAQAAALGIPRIAFINKMDRSGAGFGRTVREIVAKLKTRVALLTLPYFNGDEFKGVIDVLNNKQLTWTDASGRQVEVKDAENPDAIKARENIIDTLADVDEEILDAFMEHEDYAKIPNSLIQAALRRATISNQIVPVFCGASFRNIGVQPLLDGIIDYLPEPNLFKDSKNVTALAFKVSHDPIRGPLTFIRVYSGTLKKGSMVYNTTQQTKERASQILQMQADQPVDIPMVSAGNIAVITGSQHIKTGDTLVAHATKKDGINHLSASDKQLSLLPIDIPPPVFMSRLSPRNAGDKRSMDQALSILLREDPSLQISYDDENGQWLLAGMGELHLEIARDRLINDLKANIEVGDIMITLKETLGSPSQTCIARSTTDGIIEVKVSVSPNKEGQIPLSDNNFVSVHHNKHPFITREKIMRNASVGVTPVVAKGGQLARAALRGVCFNVEVNLSVETQNPDSIAPLVRQAAQECISSLSLADFVVLEPFMKVTVSAPQDEVGAVMTDISNIRHGHIIGMGEVESTPEDLEFRQLADRTFVPTDHTMYMSKHEQELSRPTSVHAVVPLRTMIGYLSSLRSMTQGRGTFQMVFDSYEPVPPQDVESVVS